jgi:site-specific DNA-methyltransferase (cytosine-N4-specific)
VTARYIIGDSLTVLRSMSDQSVDCVVTSPPYLNLRSYLPADHPSKDAEIGQEDTPGAFVESLLTLTDELWRVLADDGTCWINLGDTAAFSGGSGGDYLPGGMREGQARYEGSARKATNVKRWNREKADWPRPKSVCWVPQLFGASLAYGRNLLTGQEHRQWVTRQEIVWCKPNPPVGELIDKFRPASERIVFAVKEGRYWFDLDATRRPGKYGTEGKVGGGVPRRGTFPRSSGDKGDNGGGRAMRTGVDNPLGVPPLDWWEVATAPYRGSHFATFPPDLIVRPIVAGCKPGGTVLDPFAGSGTTLAVATGHGRNAIGIDLDERNADLARERVGMWLEIEHHDPKQAIA